jgi:GAF domain-containing protein
MVPHLLFAGRDHDRFPMKKRKPLVQRTRPGARALPIGWSPPVHFKVPIPKDEKQRLAALDSYAILDTPPEEALDGITELAAHVCNTPVALMVLIDRDRQWFKAAVGVRIRETPREFSFCAHTIMQRGLYVIRDATLDKRFATNPFVVSGPKFRFYAGAPLVTPDNRALGTICVIDRVRRTLTGAQKKDLLALSRVVMTELELRRILIRERGVKGKRPSWSSRIQEFV